MTDNHEVEALLKKADSLPYGPQERAALDEALRIAESNGDEDLGYRVRMRLQSSAAMTGDTDTLIATFSWCLGKHDSDPARFPRILPEAGGDLFWHYKWVITRLAANPIFPLAMLRDAESDMRRRFEQAGVGLSGFYSAACSAALATGDLDRVAELRGALERAPRDSLSDCEACTFSTIAQAQVALGDEAGAIDTVRRLLNRGITCVEEPARALSVLLLPYLRAGRTEEARQANKKSMRTAREHRDLVDVIGRNLAFLAVTGNEAQGLAELERHLGWLASDSLDAEGHFEALWAVGLLCDKVAAAGHGDAPVRAAGDEALARFFGERSVPWSADDLASAAWSAAERIAAAFDERDGNSYYATSLERARALRSERWDLPLGGAAFAPTVEIAPVPDPVDAAGWEERAWDLAQFQDLAGAERAAKAALAAAPASLTALGADSVLIQALFRQGRRAEAETALTAHVARMRALGFDVAADVSEQCGLAVYGSLDDADPAALEAAWERFGGASVPDDAADVGPAGPAEVGVEEARALADAGRLRGLARIARSLGEAKAESDPEAAELWLRRTMAAHRMASNWDSEQITALRHAALLAQLGGPEAKTLAEAELTAIASAPATRLVGFLADLMLAQIGPFRGEGEESSLVPARRARQAAAAFGHARAIEQAAATVASCHLAADQYDDAARQFRVAAEARAATGSPRSWRYDLALAQIAGNQGGVEESIAALTELLDWVVAASAATPLSDPTLSPVDKDSARDLAEGVPAVRYALGNGLKAFGDLSGAARNFHRAALAFADLDDHGQEAGAYLQLGGLLVGAGQLDDARAELGNAVAAARAAGERNTNLLVQCLKELAEAEGRASGGEADSPLFAKALAHYDEATAIARGTGENTLASFVIDSKSRDLARAGRHVDALELMDIAIEGFLEGDAPLAAADSHLVRAIMLAQTGDEAAAGAACEAAMALSTPESRYYRDGARQGARHYRSAGMPADAARLDAAADDAEGGERA